MKGDNGSWVEDIDFSFLLPRLPLFSPTPWNFNALFFSHFYILPATFAIILFHLSLCPFYFACIFLSIFSFIHSMLHAPRYTHAHTSHFSSCFFFLSLSSDPGAVVETHSAVPYAVVGGVLALLVFAIICVLIVTIWCSVRQKGNK